MVVGVSNLVRTTARIWGLQEPDLKLYSRRLIDSYLLPVSRGRTVAPIDEVHAALFLIAVMATGRPSEAPRAAQQYGQMPVKGNASDTAPTFHGMLTSIIEGRHDAISKQIQEGEIVVNRLWPEAHIIWSDGKVTEFAPRDAEPTAGMRVEARISGARLLQVALFLWKPEATWGADENAGVD